MNAIEKIKSEKDGLLIKEDIKAFAEKGWESISEADVQRLKWYGLFLRKPTPGYFMLRVRIPNGKSFSHQIKALTQIARCYGNGEIDVTTRQQLQIRHLEIENVPHVFEILEAVGLTSAQTGMDNVRNIMGCAVAGLNPKEAMDASWIVSALNDHLLGNPEYSNLPRKFNIAITGCTENCLHTETQDLGLIPAVSPDGTETQGFNIIVGGKLGSGGYRIATPLNVFVTPEEAVETCLGIIALFRDHGSREIRTQNRLAFLIEEWGEEKFREALTLRLGRELSVAGVDQRELARSEHIGIYRQKQSTMNYVGLKIMVGRIQAEKLEGLADLSEKYGSGEIRFTAGQSLILTNISDKKLGDFLEEPLLKEFLYYPSGVSSDLVSCVGSDYCHMATIETKSRALQTAKRLEAKLGKSDPISMHWSGCPAGCGNHLVADVGLLGKKARVGGVVVDAVDIFMGGRAGPHPKLAVKMMENVPCDILPEVLAHIIPYHTREKMHPVKKGKRGAKSRARGATLVKDTIAKKPLNAPLAMEG
ncbi:MAG: ferredoxin--nitrite reductase [Candidatus Nitrohelix vancouverensis]|uniref:Ferredoxin--nitrite reductase n=1 Tax=Candidatus Nitrohelix vancouverensis TaxID=2705534 RepID=A0A7T0C4Q1_9BACT|nr:MAG: ferredoxin--nitrite reductase [Candidatus Nitrohelix vancouverensis]